MGEHPWLVLSCSPYWRCLCLHKEEWLMLLRGINNTICLAEVCGSALSECFSSCDRFGEKLIAMVGTSTSELTRKKWPCTGLAVALYRCSTSSSTKMIWWKSPEFFSEAIDDGMQYLRGEIHVLYWSERFYQLCRHVYNYFTRYQFDN